MKHCYSAVSLLYLLNQEKITPKFAEVKIHLLLQKCKKLPQTCGFAVTDHLLLFCGICFCESAKKIPQTFVFAVTDHLLLFCGICFCESAKKIPQTCVFAVTDHLLLFCGICSRGIESIKFAVPNTAKNANRTS